MKVRAGMVVCLLLVGIAALSGTKVQAQQRSSAAAGPPEGTMGPIMSLGVRQQAENQIQQQAAVNAARHAQLTADTARMVALANELKAATEKTSKDTLSLDVVKKAEEIEKLAHQMKNKMKN